MTGTIWPIGSPQNSISRLHADVGVDAHDDAGVDTRDDDDVDVGVDACG